MDELNIPIKVLIVDDMESFRVRFNNILKSDKRIEVVGLAKNGYESIVLSVLHKPDVILMDVKMESESAGIDACREITKMLPLTKIIISSVLDDDETIFKAYQTGVVDYIIKKNATSKDVLNAVYNAYSKTSSIRPEIAEKVRKEFQKMLNYKDSFLLTLSIVSNLTHVEIDILLLLCDGRTRQEISEMRCIAFSTVKTHINNILSKFNKSSSKELVQMINQHNIVEMLKQARSSVLTK